MTTPENLPPLPEQIISDVMRDVDAYAFDYQAQQKLAPSRVEVERAIRRAYDAGRAAGAQVADGWRDTIKRAADLIRENARSLRECHTIPPEYKCWGGDDAAREEYESEIALAKALDGLASAPAAAAQPAATARTEPVALTDEQISDIARDAQIAFCLGKHESFEMALARAIERAVWQANAIGKEGSK